MYFMHIPTGCRTDVTKFIHKHLDRLQQTALLEEDEGLEWTQWAADMRPLWVSTNYLSDLNSPLQTFPKGVLQMAVTDIMKATNSNVCASNDLLELEEKLEHAWEGINLPAPNCFPALPTGWGDGEIGMEVCK